MMIIAKLLRDEVVRKCYVHGLCEGFYVVMIANVLQEDVEWRCCVKMLREDVCVMMLNDVKVIFTADLVKQYEICVWNCWRVLMMMEWEVGYDMRDLQ